MILAIDPGNIETGYVIVDEETLKPIFVGKVLNKELEEIIIKSKDSITIEHVAIEMVASYGMAVGATVFETCVWIGRFYQCCKENLGIEATLIYRKDEKMNLCNSMKAKDSNITQSLIDRFAPNTPNKGKGNKKDKGWFYGFKKDIWAAYAVAVTYKDIYLCEEGNDEQNPKEIPK